MEKAAPETGNTAEVIIMFPNDLDISRHISTLKKTTTLLKVWKTCFHRNFCHLQLIIVLGVTS